MTRTKASYSIEVHYPETQEQMSELRKRMGYAYIDFVKNYIKALSINNDEKNKLYVEVTNKLIRNDDTL